MKFALLSDLGHKPTRAGRLLNNSRASGAHHITQLARDHGVDATNIDYWTEWSTATLRDSLLTWFNDDPEPWIGLSGSIGWQ